MALTEASVSQISLIPNSNAPRVAGRIGMKVSFLPEHPAATSCLLNGVVMKIH